MNIHVHVHNGVCCSVQYMGTTCMACQVPRLHAQWPSKCNTQYYLRVTISYRHDISADPHKSAKFDTCINTNIIVNHKTAKKYNVCVYENVNTNVHCILTHNNIYL